MDHRNWEDRLLDATIRLLILAMLGVVAVVVWRLVVTFV